MKFLSKLQVNEDNNRVRKCLLGYIGVMIVGFTKGVNHGYLRIL